MMKDITLGQYFPGQSLLHKLDPRVKIALTALFIVFIFIAQNFYALGIVVLLLFSVLLLSGVPLKQYFKSLKAVIFVVSFTSLLNLFYGTGTPLVTLFGFIKITANGISSAIFITIRILSLILFSSVLTFTTSPTELTDALERILKPLKILHVPVHEISMMMTIALRFVPTLLEETDKIMSAQKARGADLESGGLVQRVRALIPILIPMFVSSFRRAYDLAMAMECRCYHGGEGRTKMKQLHVSGRDYATLTVCVAVCAVIIVLSLLFPSALAR